MEMLLRLENLNAVAGRKKSPVGSAAVPCEERTVILRRIDEIGQLDLMKNATPIA
jgi:hypothetical protein